MKFKMDTVLSCLARAPQLAKYLDLTSLLGRDIYSLLPSVFIVTVTPIYLSAAFRNRRCPRYGKTLWTKIATVILILAVEFANIVLFCKVPAIRSKAAVAAAVSSGLSSLCLSLLIYAEKMYSFRPPRFLSLSLAITILFDITKARSYLEQLDFQTASRLSTAIYLLKTMLLITEETAKALAIRSQQPKRYRHSGFELRKLYLWVNSTLILGFRNVLKVNDLLDMGPKFNSELLYQQFKPIWANSPKKGNNALALALLRTLPWDFAVIFIPQLIYIAFTLSQPHLVQVTVTAVEQKGLTEDVISYLIRSTLVVYIGMAISRATAEHLNYRLITLIRGIVVSAIYDKTLALGQDQLKNSAALTLMSTDINGIEMLLMKFHEIWGRFFELFIGLFILYSIMGPASFLILVPVSVIAALSIKRAQVMGDARRDWNEKIEHRVSATSYILTQLKSIKISGFASMMVDYLHKKRLDEIQCSTRERVIRISLHTFQHVIESMTPVVVFGGGIAWFKAANHMSISDVFRTLSIIAIVSVPLARALVNIPAFVGALVCLTRIQEFLLLKDHVSSTYNAESPARTTSDRKGKAPERRKRQVYLAVELDNVAITLPGKDSPLLRNIKMNVRQGQVAMIYGPVGCGKSSLLKALLGELEMTGGFAGVDRRKVAYCDQTPWLQNHSIRDNIVAQNEHNPTRYNAVIHACALNEDIAQFTNGDATLVGSAGGALSGGQKQRVALARALYHNAELVILDDVLSALDATTAKTILYRLLGKGGMLRRFTCSVVMTTNILEDLSAADVIYTISADGEVRQAPNINQFVKDAFAKQSEKERERKPPSVENSRLLQTDETPIADIPTVSERYDDETVRQRGDLSLYNYYLHNMGWGRLVVFFFLTAMTGIWGRMPLLFVRYWIDRAPDNINYFTAFAMISASAVFLMALMVSIYYLILVPSASIKMHKTLVNTTMRLALPFISTTDTSSILTRFSQDMTMIAQLLPMSFIEVVYISVNAITTIFLVTSAASYSLAIVPAFGTLLYLIQFFYLRTSRQLRLLDLEAKVPLFKHFTETASGIEHIRAFGWQPDFLWQNYGLLDYSQKPHYYFFCTKRWLSFVLDLATCALAVTTVTLALNEEASQTAIGLSMVNLVTLSRVLTDVLESWVELETSLGAVARTRDFNENAPLERGRNVRKQADYWPTTGKIEFRDVTASYNLKSTGNKPVLKNVSLKIKAREKVAIIGRTGSGKSSLILSLLNLLDYSGKILIDGTDIKKVPIEFLRDRITTIPQDGVELDASVRLNLDPYDDPNSGHRLADETLQENLTTVGLWDVVEQRGGLDALLSKMSFSPGQKQLLCLGRALLCREYKQSRIVLIDEATSSVDVETDKRIQAVLASEFVGATVISITHRHHGVEHSDTVLEMRDGKVTHSLDRKTKIIRKLV